MMVFLNHCLCLLAVLPAVCAASFTSPRSVVHGIVLRRKAHLKRSEEIENEAFSLDKSYDQKRHGFHVWHYSSLNGHSSKFTGTGGRSTGMVSAGKKEDEQRDSEPLHSVEPLLSQQLDGSGSPGAAVSLPTALASASTPVSSTIDIGSTSPAIYNPSPSQPLSEGQTTHSPSAMSALATASSSSSPSSSFQPGLLAFILVPVCIFILGMIFALYRICGKPGNRLPPASPMFLGDATALDSGYHKDEVIAMKEPNMQARGSILGYDLNKRGSILKDVHASDLLNPPIRTHGAGNYNSPPSRVFRPNVPRPYHRPHAAYTADPEAVTPLIVNGSKNRTNISGHRGYTTPNSKGKGKENVPQERGHNARKHRDDISTTPLNTSPRSLTFRDPVISAVFSDMDIRFQAKTQRSPSSLTSLTKNKSQLEVPSQSSTSTSFDIGLAMMTDFSSPNVGLGLDLSPCPSSPEHISSKALSQTAGDLVNGPARGISREVASPYLEHSVTVGSNGLAYLSDPSQEMMLLDKESEPEDELDIVSALAVYKIQHARDRLKAHKDLVDQKSKPQHTENENQDSPGSSSSCELEARYTPSDVKAPTLPTLSEMALSRADPLYESVTNELFSSYGMRMSTGSALGQPSRVSARISRMLSWFTGADSRNSSSRISGIDNRMSCDDAKFYGEGHGERVSDMSLPGEVQPLRIGKVRKNAV